jgi:cell pole-organizing protein PopZ
MSEQTPETAAKTRNEDGFDDAASEPSMEDILASIRKIISDDADPLPLDGPDAASPLSPAATVVDPVPETAVTAEATEASGDNDFDLDSLLGELGEADVSNPATPSLSGAIGLDNFEDISIPELETKSVDTADVSVKDDMDQLMNELLMDMDMPATDVPPASETVEGPVAASVAPSVDSDDDMDVVRSLMADLTDDDLDPSTGNASDGLDLDAMMDELEGFDVEISAEAAKPDMDPVAEIEDLDAMEEDIFDSILEMTLDDEIDAFDAQSDGDGPSLAAIAAKADADAAPASVVRSTSVLGAELTDADTSEASPSDAPTDPGAAKTADGATSQSPAKPAPSEMEIPMPRALRSDAILDDVTENATMSAFAELNQVVEDKAILSERGPRIGDLVQDALKPMLKEWLDANIQGIVERAVAKEVQRIANGK